MTREAEPPKNRRSDAPGWPMLYCKICGRTVGRYPPNETRINRDRCLTCIIAGKKINEPS